MYAINPYITNMSISYLIDFYPNMEVSRNFKKEFLIPYPLLKMFVMFVRWDDREKFAYKQH